MKRPVRTPERNTGRFTRRGLLVGGAMGSYLVVLGARAHYLGVTEAAKYRLLADKNRINLQLLLPPRGLILDRNGKLLAGNEQNYEVTMTREGAGNVQEVLNKLSHIIALTAADMARVKRQLRQNAPFVPITVADRLSWDEFSRVNLNAPVLPGVTPGMGLSRYYPWDSDFAHVVGYVGPVSARDLKDQTTPDPLLQIPGYQIGKVGVERRMEMDLRGKAGTRKIEVNAIGREVRRLSQVNGTPGENVVLTLDAGLQDFLHARMANQAGGAVMMDVTTGDVLASVSSPSFNPNLFVRGISYTDYAKLTGNDHKPLANKAVQGGYAPGSTFKIVSALAALDAQKITPDHKIYCPGYLDIGGRRFNCWKHSGHGWMDMRHAIEQSCDVYFYTVGLQTGIDTIAKMGRRMGLGVRHELPMSAISAGVMPDKKWLKRRYNQQWLIGDTANAAIGQGYVLATPLQLCVMAMRVATGRSVQPRLVKSIGGIEQPLVQPTALGVDGTALQTVRDGMKMVVSDTLGTGHASRIVDPAMQMAGKTGTAQVRTMARGTASVPNDQLPWKQRDHALFVAYAPVDAPKYAVAVLIEHGGEGAVAAAPIARDALLRAMTGGMPPLSAYPASERNQAGALLKSLKLRDVNGAIQGTTKA